MTRLDEIEKLWITNEGVGITIGNTQYQAMDDIKWLVGKLRECEYTVDWIHNYLIMGLDETVDQFAWVEDAKAEAEKFLKSIREEK